VATGWCYYVITGPEAKRWSHDVSGWLMMPLALALVGLELVILDWLVPDGQSEEDDQKPVSPLLTKKGPGKDQLSNQDLGEV
jgi:hypothetical protein